MDFKKIWNLYHSYEKYVEDVKYSDFVERIYIKIVVESNYDKAEVK